MEPLTPRFTDRDADAALAEINALLRRAFAAPDPYHGPGHTLHVEATVVDLCAQPDVAVSPVECFTLRAAALLHDTGYGAYTPNWSQDRREHVAAGLIYAARELPRVTIFAARP